MVANREVSRLKALFNAAIKWELYEGKNPAVGIRPVEEPEGRLRFLDYTEEAALLKVAPHDRDWDQLRYSSEALTLTWKNVDLQRNQLTVSAAFAKTGETRSIPLNSRTREVMVRLKAKSRSELCVQQTQRTLPTNPWTSCSLAPARTQDSREQGSPSIRSTIPLPHGW